MRTAAGRVLALLLVLALMALCATISLNTPVDAREPELPTSGEELWWSLPAELLLNVIEGKMEEIGSLKGRIRQLEAELERVREIQQMKMAEARPPPEE